MQEIYSDVFHIQMSEWGIIITLGLRGSLPGEPDQFLTHLRLSHPTAKTLAIQLLQLVRQFEQQMGKGVKLSPETLQKLGIPIEDWGAWGIEG